MKERKEIINAYYRFWVKMRGTSSRYYDAAAAR